jgi:hypothetical protein
MTIKELEHLSPAGALKYFKGLPVEEIHSLIDSLSPAYIHILERDIDFLRWFSQLKKNKKIDTEGDL